MREYTDNASPQDPVPATLLPNRTATIFFDGLILGAYDQERSLYQAAVHIEAEKHHLEITVTRNGQPFWPRTDADWDGSLETIRALAPFWLFVDSGKGVPDDFNATLHNLEEPRDPRSFAQIFNFERQHGRPLALNTNRFAEFNFPHGTAYSALNTDAKLERLEQNQNPSQATVVNEHVNVSTLGAIDIDQVSSNGSNRELVLISQGRKEPFFRLPLEAGTTYEIKVLNVPDPDHAHSQPQAGEHPHPNPEEHFLQYYELFSLKEGEKKFLIRPAASTAFGGGPDSPPCIGGATSTRTGLRTT